MHARANTHTSTLTHILAALMRPRPRTGNTCIPEPCPRLKRSSRRARHFSGLCSLSASARSSWPSTHTHTSTLTCVCACGERSGGWGRTETWMRAPGKAFSPTTTPMMQEKPHRPTFVSASSFPTIRRRAHSHTLHKLTLTRSHTHTPVDESGGSGRWPRTGRCGRSLCQREVAKDRHVRKAHCGASPHTNTFHPPTPRQQQEVTRAFRSAPPAQRATTTARFERNTHTLTHTHPTFRRFGTTPSSSPRREIPTAPTTP